MNSNAATTNDSTSPEPPPAHTNNQLIGTSQPYIAVKNFSPALLRKLLRLEIEFEN
jgi:hypothetical protein